MKIYIHTLGCKVNQYETGALETLLRERGHELCEAPAGCDAVIINTCAVTAESERKSRQAIRRISAEAEGALVAVCGCCSQVSPESVKKLGVSLIGGSGDRRGFAAELERVYAEKTESTVLDDALRRREFEMLPSGNEAGRTRAMLKIEDGCSNFCSYCIIPYARGPVRSMPLENVAEEAASLRERGFKEIVITGIEAASYGRDLPGKPALAEAVKTAAAAAPGVRLRLGSLEPRCVTEEFCQTLAAVPDMCPHFHLSLQSGCDTVLSRMRRKYDTARFYESVTLLRKYFTDCAVAADLICGFPGETEEEFSETLEFIKKCSFASMHVFPYSVRPGTVAAGLAGQLSAAEKHDRARRAIAVAGEMHGEYLKSCIGKRFRVLFETESGGFSKGHTENYCEAAAEITGMRGKIAEVTINKVKNGILFGEICL